jgi:hypothetical protein
MSSIEVKPLRGFGREAQLKKKWNRLWAEIGERILRLPKREQDILLEDFHTAIQSRMLVMERINNAERNH